MIERLALIEPDWAPTETWGYKAEEVNTSFLTEAYIRENYSSAGILPLSEDGQEILLGAHEEGDLLLWGPFAGNKEPGEEVEETALREGLQELGVRAKLHPPTVLVDMVSGDPRVGVIFPTILKKQEFPRVPNQEIARVKWFGWGHLTELQDMYDSTYYLWGGLYTWILLDFWHDMRQLAERENVHTIKKMHGVQIQLGVGIGFGFSETPYLKRRKRKRENVS